MDRTTSEAIATIYDVVIDPAAWERILDLLSDHVSAVGTSVFHTDHLIKELRGIWLSSALKPHVPAYFDHGFDKLETEFVYALPSVMTSANLTSIQDLVKQVNRECQTAIDLEPVEKWSAESFAVHHRYTTPLSFNPAYFDNVTFQFGMVRRTVLRARLHEAALFLPHLAKAIEISRPFVLLQNRFQGVLDFLDRFHLGVFILNDTGTVVTLNRSADQILDSGDGIRLDLQRRLYLVDSETNLLWKRATNRLMNTITGPRAGEKLKVPRNSGVTPYLIELSVIGGRELDGCLPFQGLLAVVVDPENLAIVDSSGMQHVYGFTEAEKAVCDLLVEGLNTEDIAESRGVRIDTVRTQIKSLLRKTDSSSRADLIRLALSINLPVDKPDST